MPKSNSSNTIKRRIHNAGVRNEKIYDIIKKLEILREQLEMFKNTGKLEHTGEPDFYITQWNSLTEKLIKAIQHKNDNDEAILRNAEKLRTRYQTRRSKSKAKSSSK